MVHVGKYIVDDVFLLVVNQINSAPLGYPKANLGIFELMMFPYPGPPKVGRCMLVMWSILWNYPPTQDASQHQDYEPFLVGNPNLNLHL